ncbi:unnamed protein product [marine sediment metagenome]|uniref:Uncharacterized protein n=1 Tax=marine sediment metagenome TaxID=412755 RepID=X1D9T5_9ZZZZ
MIYFFYFIIFTKVMTILLYESGVNSTEKENNSGMENHTDKESNTDVKNI